MKAELRITSGSLLGTEVAMLLGAAKPLQIEFLHNNTRLKVRDFPSGRAKTYSECLAVVREAIRAC